MSRVGRQPVAIPGGVKVDLQGNVLSIEGPKGKLQCQFRPEISLEFNQDSKAITVSRINDERQSRAFHGLSRALVSNMVEGVTKGFEKKLEVVGVGYLAAVQGDQLQLRVGYANEVHKPIPKGLTVTCPSQNQIVVQGCDKQQVGQFAAEVRAVRKPEPYKGKGVRYDGEQVKIKPGKAAT